MIRVASIITSWIVLIIACSKEGNTGDHGPLPLPEPTPAPSAEPPTSDTGVGLALTVAPSPKQTRCAANLEILDPWRRVPSFRLDGSSEEWMGAGPVAQDPDGDSRVGDIIAIRTGTTLSHRAEQFAGLISFRQDFVGSLVFWEFGVTSTIGTNVSTQTTRRFKSDGRNLWVYDFETEQYLDPHPLRGSVASSAEHIEFAIPMLQLEGVFLHQSWFMRAWTELAENGDALDEMGAAFFTGKAPTVALPSHKQCLASRIGGSQLVFSELVFPGVDQELADRILGLGRTAFEAVFSAFDRQKLSVSQLGVVVSPDDRFDQSSPVFRPRDRSRLYRELRLPANLYADSSILYERDKVILAKSIMHFAHLFLDSIYPQAPTHLRGLLVAMIVDEILRVRLGDAFFLVSSMDDSHEFRLSDDAAAPKSLLEWMDAFVETEPVAPRQWSKYAAKVQGLAHILASRIRSDQVVRVVSQLASDGPYISEHTENLFIELIGKELGTEPGEGPFAACWSGWLLPGSYHANCAPNQLADPDSDGIPSYLEAVIGSDPHKLDTDGDGWTDYAEFLMRKDPRSKASTPDLIVADGHFGDWQALLPNKVSVDVGIMSSECPAAADITHFAGLLSGTRLVIAAIARDLWETEPRVRWESLVEAQTRQGLRRFTFRTISGSTDFEVRDTNTGELLKVVRNTIPMGMQSVEWVIDFGVEGLALDDISAKNVRFRVQTVYERTDRLICDDTAWTTPLTQR